MNTTSSTAYNYKVVRQFAIMTVVSVSYTHLTLPTTPYV